MPDQYMSGRLVTDVLLFGDFPSSPRTDGTYPPGSATAAFTAKRRTLVPAVACDLGNLRYTG